MSPLVQFIDGLLVVLVLLALALMAWVLRDCRRGLLEAERQFATTSVQVAKSLFACGHVEEAARFEELATRLEAAAARDRWNRGRW